jgi:integrase
MGIGKQAKILNEHQLQALLAWLDTRKYSDRNRLIVLLSFKAGLRAKEIALLKWSMVMTADGEIGDRIHLTDQASKGRSGRTIALNKELKKQLIKVKEIDSIDRTESQGSLGISRRGFNRAREVAMMAFETTTSPITLSASPL